MVTYCRIHGLSSEKGKRLNGRVGEIITASSDAAAVTGTGTSDTTSTAVTTNERVTVQIDGERGAKIIKTKNVHTLEAEDSTQYRLSWAFDSSSSDFQFALSDPADSDSILIAGGLGAPDSRFHSSAHAILLSLKAILEQLRFNTPTVLHVPDLNVAICLNKLLEGDTDLIPSLTERFDVYTSESAPFLTNVVKALLTNPRKTFVKWTPNQNLHPRPVDGGEVTYQASMELSGEMGSLQPSSTNTYANFPPQLAYFPQDETFDDITKSIDSVFKGIYHIYPNRSIENCYDVIYAADGKCSIKMGSFMDIGPASITEHYIFTQRLRDTYRLTSQGCAAVDIMTFWGIIMRLEEYRKVEENGFVVLPFLTNAPANNRKLLKKRTTAVDDKKGMLLPPAEISFSDGQEREQMSDRHARLGALLCMIELKCRSNNDHDPDRITLQVADHLVGTDLAQDMEDALVQVNKGNYQQAARVLNGGRFCGYCGVKEEGDVKLSTCSGCKVVAYCGRDCQKNDYRPKHRGICSALKADREGLPPKEMDYEVFVGLQLMRDQRFSG